MRAPAAPTAPTVSEILDVLLDNARRHGEGEVSLSARPAGDYVAIEVRDAGAGFTLDVEQAFERRHGAGDGHGIGLALARSLAHAEGGRLDVPNPGPQPVLPLLLRRCAAAAAPARGDDSA